MDQSEPDRAKLITFIKVVNETHKPSRLKYTSSTDYTNRPAYTRELSVQGVAILSDN